MNGNVWTTVFRFDKKSGHFYNAGHYNSDEETDTVTREIRATYGGSWYMPVSQTLWRWSQGKLVRVRYVEVGLVVDDMKNSDNVLTYWENPEWQSGRDTLVLRKRQLFMSEEDPEQSVYWKDFFNLH